MLDTARPKKIAALAPVIDIPASIARPQQPHGSIVHGRKSVGISEVHIPPPLIQDLLQDRVESIQGGNVQYAGSETRDLSAACFRA